MSSSLIAARRPRKISKSVDGSSRRATARSADASVAPGPAPGVFIWPASFPRHRRSSGRGSWASRGCKRPGGQRWRLINRARGGMVIRTVTADYFARLRTITCVYAPMVANRVRPRKPSDEAASRDALSPRRLREQSPLDRRLLVPGPPSTQAFRMPSTCSAQLLEGPSRRCRKRPAAAEIVPVRPQSRSSHRLDAGLTRRIPLDQD
jgi:hypothetical protein